MINTAETMWHPCLHVLLSVVTDLVVAEQRLHLLKLPMMIHVLFVCEPGGTYLLCNYVSSACCCCICLQPVQPFWIPIKGQHTALAAHQRCKAPSPPLLKRRIQCIQASGDQMMLRFKLTEYTLPNSFEDKCQKLGQQSQAGQQTDQGQQFKQQRQ